MSAIKQLNFGGKDSVSAQGPSLHFGSAASLEEITRSAQHLTGANGAALVLSDGKIMLCRACSGELVPPVGTRLNTDAGFTATCVQTAKVVRCDDTETDPRVDGSRCSKLGIRSILAVPVFDGQHVAGVLEVLSSEPRKFGDRHAIALRLLARVIETVANCASRGDGSLGTLTPEAKFRTGADDVMLMCLSCGHQNPQASQFCNRCGVILLVSSRPPDATADRSLPSGTGSTADEGLTEIYKLIAGDGGLATWNEIYTKLLANMRSSPPQNKPPRAVTNTKEETARRSDGEIGLAKTQGVTELKGQPGTPLRRNLWL